MSMFIEYSGTCSIENIFRVPLKIGVNAAKSVPIVSFDPNLIQKVSGLVSH